MTSKIKVDNVNKVSDDSNIINKCGTTITLGASGDSINLASGATQSGFGREGSVDWDTSSIKTANFTAVTGNGYFCNTAASGAFDLQLPASPSAGDIVGLKDYNANFGTANLTIDRNGSNLDGNAGNKILNTSNLSLTLVYVDGTQGWVAIEEGTGNIGVVPTYVVASATGCTGPGAGCIVCTNYKVHTFTSPGTFVVSCAGNPAGSNRVSYLVVAGGGGGGSRQHAGGGGAGGFREDKAPFCSYTSSPGAATTGFPVTATPYPVGVGGGGPGGPAPGNSPGTAGTSSNFSTIISAGGGKGSSYTPGPQVPSQPPTLAGGSGGAAGGTCTPSGPYSGGLGNQPPVSPAQGKDGGDGDTHNSNGAGGGGGGAGACGVSSSSGLGGAGGAGATTSINGTPTARAGGGGGAAYDSPASPGGQPGGTGGGGSGAGGNNATPTSGGGGGGGGGASGCNSGGNGGGGTVIIRYKFQ